MMPGMRSKNGAGSGFREGAPNAKRYDIIMIKYFIIKNKIFYGS